MPRRSSCVHRSIPAVLLVPALAMAQAPGNAACPHFELSAVPGRLDSPLLRETSGLVAGRRSPGVLWIHNDSGDSTRFFAINQQGELLAEFDLQGPDIEAKDWEDIAIGPGRSADASYLYLGDIGDNATRRTTIDVYRVLEPSVDTTARRKKVAIDRGQVERITLQYPGSKPHNAETLLVDPVDGALYVVTKDLDSGRVFRASAEMLKDHAHLTLAQVAAVNPRRFDIRVTGLTGGDISADGAWIILRNRTEGFLWPRKPGTSLAATLSANPEAPCLISVGDGETLGLLPDGSAYFTIQEGVGRPVFRFDRETPAPPRPRRPTREPPDIDFVLPIAIGQMRTDYFDRQR